MIEKVQTYPSEPTPPATYCLECDPSESIALQILRLCATVSPVRSCIYCGLRPGDTLDHVPPKCVFDSPMPNGTQRITVPCCEVCRRAGQNDEALYRDLFISTRASEKNRKATNLAAKRNKSFENDWSQVERVVRHMCLVDVFTPQGNVRDFAFNFDSPEMHRFILRMCRALLHEEAGSGHIECRIVNWKVNPENDLRKDLLAIAKGVWFRRNLRMRDSSSAENPSLVGC